MNKYNWGILGAGRIAEKFVEALKITERARAYAIASRERERAYQFGKKHGIEKIYDSYEDLVNDLAVDIIYIATPHVFHCEQTLLCLRNKKAVLCEKPMGMNATENKRMMNEARRQQVFLMEGMWSRFMPAINKAKQLVEEDAIGALQYLQCNFGFTAPFDAVGRLYNKQLGGGSILDVGVYAVFLANYFLGTPVSIQSNSSLTTTGVDAYCNAILQYASGATAHLFTSITLPIEIKATLTGSKGRLELPAPWYKTTDLHWYPLNGVAQQFRFPHKSNGLEYEISEVMDCLDNRLLECPAMPLDSTLQISEILDVLLKQAGVSYGVGVRLE
jgi:predicted dehydrogenase